MAWLPACAPLAQVTWGSDSAPLPRRCAAASPPRVVASAAAPSANSNPCVLFIGMSSWCGGAPAARGGTDETHDGSTLGRHALRQHGAIRRQRGDPQLLGRSRDVFELGL